MSYRTLFVLASALTIVSLVALVLTALPPHRHLLADQVIAGVWGVNLFLNSRTAITSWRAWRRERLVRRYYRESASTGW